MKTTTEKNIYPFLNGGGEMGEYTRNFDWSETAVGAPGNWPQSLRTTVNILLNSRLPMFLFWGAEHICFYNDAYRPSLGNDGKHPAALGMPGKKVWPDVWEYINPLIQQVLSGQGATWNEDQLVPIYRNGRMDEVYWTFSHSLVSDEAGDPAGVFVTCTETTEKVVNVRQLQESKNQLEFAIDAAELATWDFNPISNTFTANERYSDWFGIAAETETNNDHALEVIAAEDRERVIKAYTSALDFSLKTKYDIIYTIRPKNLPERILLAKGKAWFGEDKIAYRFTGTLQDITEAETAQTAVRISEQNLRNIFEQAPIAMALFRGPDLIIEIANVRLLDYWAKTAGQVIGKPLFEVRYELAGRGFEEVLENVLATGETYSDFEVPVPLIRSGKLEQVYVSFVYEAYREANGVISGVMSASYDVTAEVIARKKQHESENRFRSLVEEAPVATCLFVGRELRVEVANQIMIRYWGKDNSIIGKPLHEAVPELKGQPFLAILDNVFLTGEPYTVSGAEVMLELNGKLQTFYFDLTYKPLLNTSGKVYAIMDMAVDVTAGVIARKKLEESELFSRSVIINSPVAEIVFTGLEMTINIVNQNMMEMLGRDESIIGQPFFSAIPELLDTEFPQRLQMVYETGITYSHPEEKITLLKFGNPYTGYYNYIYKALYNVTGDIYGIIVTATEVTTQVAARQQAEEAGEAFRNAVELAELGTWTMDLLNNTLDFSQRLRKWYGFEKDESITPEKADESILDSGREMMRIALLNAINPDSRKGYDVEYTVINKLNSRQRIVHAQGKVFFDTNGKAYKLSGTAQDVTTQRRVQLDLERQVQERTEELASAIENIRSANEELNESNRQLIRSNEELAQYAYVASHDLQEPLRKIRMFSSLLSDQELPDQSIALVTKIDNSTKRMTMLIRDLLDFSRLLNSDLLFQPVDLSKIVSAVLEDFELVIEEKAVEVKIDPLPVVEGVGLQMNQLFYNLVSNALKFNQKGITPELTITSAVLSLEEASGYIDKLNDCAYHRISITDNGIGFEQKYADKIFEVFNRLHGKDAYPGSGIGLAICRRIIVNHKGLLYTESAPGKGAAFHIIFPEKQNTA